MRGLCGVYSYDCVKPDLRAFSGNLVVSQNQTVYIVFDGTIHNRTELKRELTDRRFRFQDTSDSELASKLYEDYGIDGLHKIRGVFSLAILDHNRDCFYLVRDRLGIKPLYYILATGSVVFGSCVASLFSSSSVTPEINPEALKYFFFGVRNSPETLFKHVLTVPPGHYLMINRNGHFVREYWDVRFPEHPAEPKHPAAHYVDELDSLLTETVKLYMGNAESPTALPHLVDPVDLQPSSVVVLTRVSSVVSQASYAICIHTQSPLRRLDTNDMMNLMMRV